MTPKEIARQIAAEYLLIDSLDPQGWDSADFEEVYVGAIEDALIAAYNLGVAHAATVPA